MAKEFTAILHQEDETYIAHCPEIDIVSQGESIEEAKENLKEAIELFMEHAPDEEKKRRIHSDILVTTVTA